MATTLERSGLDLAALDRALAQGLRVRRIGEHVWTVTSHSRPGHEYTVRDDDGVYCTCRAGLASVCCKHREAVRAVIALVGDALPVERPAADPRDTAILATAQRGRGFFRYPEITVED